METAEVRWDGVIVGQLDFFPQQRLGLLRQLGMPPYTRTLGPVLSLPPSSEVQRALNVRRVVGELVAQLPHHDRFFHILDPGDTTAFAFSLSGCSVLQDYTFRIPAGTDPAGALRNVAPPTRRLIRGAARKLTVESHLSLSRFLAMVRQDHAAQHSTHDLSALGRLFEAAKLNDSTIILSAVDGDGVDLASVILVWDDRVLYYWLPQRDRVRAGGGANAFLLSQAICFAMERHLEFDFDSYNSVGNARFLASFGASPIVRPVIIHNSWRFAAADLIRRAFRRHAIVGGVRPDPAARISFHNARNSHRGS